MRALAALVVALGVVGTALGAASTNVIKGDKSAGGIVIGRSTAADVGRLFGAPTTSSELSLGACRQSWKGARLEVEFFSFRGEPCPRRVALTVTVTGRAGWRTDAGLRVGDAVARLRALYSRARLRAGFTGETGYWLVTRQRCSEAGGGAYPGLLARTRNGRVTAIVVRSAVCDYD